MIRGTGRGRRSLDPHQCGRVQGAVTSNSLQTAAVPFGDTGPGIRSSSALFTVPLTVARAYVPATSADNQFGSRNIHYVKSLGQVNGDGPAVSQTGAKRPAQFDWF